MESHGAPGRIQVSEAFRELTRDVFVFEDGSATVSIWVPDADIEDEVHGDTLGLALAAALLAAPPKAGEP